MEDQSDGGTGGRRRTRDVLRGGVLTGSATGLVESVRATTDPERVEHEVAGGHDDQPATSPLDLLVGE